MLICCGFAWAVRMGRVAWSRQKCQCQRRQWITNYIAPNIQFSPNMKVNDLPIRWNSGSTKNASSSPRSTIPSHTSTHPHDLRHRHFIRRPLLFLKVTVVAHCLECSSTASTLPSLMYVTQPESLNPQSCSPSLSLEEFWSERAQLTSSPCIGSLSPWSPSATATVPVLLRNTKPSSSTKRLLCYYSPFSRCFSTTKTSWKAPHSLWIFRCQMSAGE